MKLENEMQRKELKKDGEKGEGDVWKCDKNALLFGHPTAMHALFISALASLL